MITSTANAQVKNVITLLKKSGERKKRGLFVIEGIRMFSELPKDRIEKIYVSESFLKENKELLKEIISTGKVSTLWLRKGSNKAFLVRYFRECGYSISIDD